MRTTRSIGQQGEKQASAELERLGYQIIERNYRALRGEVDLIARHGACLCFIEVRSRADLDHGHPLETINLKKQQRIIRAAEQYLAEHPQDCDLRFDVVSVIYGENPTIEVIENAFEA